MRFTNWGRPAPPDPDSVLAAAAKASRGETLTPDEEVMLGRRIPGGAAHLGETPTEPGLERVRIHPGGKTTLTGDPTPMSDIEERINETGGTWINPTVAAQTGMTGIPADGYLPDVRGVVTRQKRPDMSDPHIPGVTYWLYRWWGRDATTGDLYLLYVGETEQRPVDRLIEHLTDRTAPARHFKHLLWAWEVDPRVFPSKKAVRRAEDRAVKTEWPAQNTQLQSPDNTRLWSTRIHRPYPRVAPWLTTRTLWTTAMIAVPVLAVTILLWQIGRLSPATLACPTATIVFLVGSVRLLARRPRPVKYQTSPPATTGRQKKGGYRR